MLFHAVESRLFPCCTVLISLSGLRFIFSSPAFFNLCVEILATFSVHLCCELLARNIHALLDQCTSLRWPNSFCLPAILQPSRATLLETLPRILITNAVELPVISLTQGAIAQKALINLYLTAIERTNLGWKSVGLIYLAWHKVSH